MFKRILPLLVLLVLAPVNLVLAQGALLPPDVRFESGPKVAGQVVGPRGAELAPNREERAGEADQRAGLVDVGDAVDLQQDHPTVRSGATEGDAARLACRGRRRG